MGGFTVMLDYGHNKASYSAVMDMARQFSAPVYTGVIGMPGDRRDESIIEVGRLCGRFFTKLYIKEDNDLRGRDAGEAAGLLYGAAIEAGMDKDRISVIYQEELALKKAITDASPGEMIIMFYEELDPAVEVLEKFRKSKGLAGRAARKPEKFGIQKSATG
jgi:cyanophycin synthetase